MVRANHSILGMAPYGRQQSDTVPGCGPVASKRMVEPFLHYPQSSVYTLNLKHSESLNSVSQINVVRSY